MNELLNFEEELSLQENKYLSFSIGEEVYAIPIKYVDDIIGVQDITFVPEQPEYLKGVINLRGIIIPVIDIRLRFGKPQRDYDDRTCIIVINYDDASIGVVVDTVLEVMSIEDSKIAEPPTFEETSDEQFMKGIGQNDDGLIIIVDCNALIQEI